MLLIIESVTNKYLFLSPLFSLSLPSACLPTHPCCLRLLLPPECLQSPIPGLPGQGKESRKGSVEKKPPMFIPMSGILTFISLALSVPNQRQEHQDLRATQNIPVPLDFSKHFYVKLEDFGDFPPPTIRMRLGLFDVWISHLLIMKIPNDIVLYNITQSRIVNN